VPGDDRPARRRDRRSLQGQHPAQIADEVRPIVADIIDELDRWLTTFADGLQHTPSGRQALPRGMGEQRGGQ